MPNLSNKKRHQQFALILLLIAVVVGLAFTVWYFNEKKNTSATSNSVVPAASERDNTYNPANVTAGD